MHPKILKRVIGNEGSHLQICQAVLLNFTRHKVKSADYPGIIPYSEGRVLFDDELDREACSVRGTMVTGLTPSDTRRLDYFEGGEYDRKKVAVHPLEDLVCLSDYEMPTVKPSALPPDSDLPGAVEVETYVFYNISYLKAEIWDFDDFCKKNAAKWYGPEYRETDRPSATP
ncbi:hypothetical protein R3P38DRAFT_2921074 [Favolaschia claudopus]|uniref:Putative gamma-glutamylcyclotransferase n=1 Tax=Favolaschia claudopus TaxID=2862362 RepID=A0AAW0C3H3_9AGAR